MKPQIIICGLGRTGYQVFCLLKQQGTAVVGVTDTPIDPSFAAYHPPDHAGDRPPDLPDLTGLQSDIIVGNLRAAATLIAAGVRDAHTLVLAANDDALNLAILTQARVLNPQIRIINRLFNTSLGDRLDRTLPDHTTMSVAALSAPVFAFAALGNRTIGQLQLFQKTWPIHEEYIDADHPWLGRPLSWLWDDRHRMLIYYIPADSQLDLVSGVLQGHPLQVGDRLIFATQPSQRTAKRSLSQHFSEFVASVRQFQRHLNSTLAVLLLLLLTIFAATITYTSVNQSVSLVDALYFSVGMITGAGGNEGVVEDSGVGIKVFTVIMMLAGAGVIGVCYALLNDFVLGSRFQQLWSHIRIPQRNHYIVCGLGGVGVQTVNQLRANGCDVVVIERDANNRFLSASRSLKVPTILGDASLPVILAAANIQGAAALLAVTSDDVANLEIALTAKGVAPKLPVIVRNQDPQFAPLAQQVFDFEAVLSPAELSAPSFAAAALGGRILGNGMTANTLWVAIATIITSHHPFCGKSVQDAAMTADFVPLYLETHQRTVHGWELLKTAMSAGDMLYLTIPAHQLDHLWRHHLTSLAVPIR
ncbi:NAD-binding protein [Leptolyngbya sp. CCY15150]|uniref:potassium channel family protein n=1 Tax=Leptolyngbya sp. CCY15150 TaxID=2767772 RepID=UPI0019520F8E|nr:NAD-binding protein [Leptolyngbya sp. CCY15150]